MWPKDAAGNHRPSSAHTTSPRHSPFACRTQQERLALPVPTEYPRAARGDTAQILKAVLSAVLSERSELRTARKPQGLRAERSGAGTVRSGGDGAEPKPAGVARRTGEP